MYNNKFVPVVTTIVFVSVLATAVFYANVALAHKAVQQPCMAPVRPENDRNELQWQLFLTQVENFRKCVGTTMAWHQDESRLHQQDAKQVVERWNSFVRHSLNVPEDFPYQPD